MKCNANRVADQWLAPRTAYICRSELVRCRLALKSSHIDAASFTTIRILSGTLMLWLTIRLSNNTNHADDNWPSAYALFAYAAAFSFAYIRLPAGTGALILFGAVQTTMIVYGLLSGERLNGRQSTGLVLAIAGLVAFMLPGISTPPLEAALLMLIAGIAWGVYSLHGKGVSDPLRMTAGNFLRAGLLTMVLSTILMPRMHMDVLGVILAILSGAIASGLGYTVWYRVVREIRTTSAAIMQLSVPVIASIGGMLFLREAMSLHLIISSAAILGGISLVIIESGN